MITVTTFLWRDPDSRWRRTFLYGPEHVNVMKRMVARRLTVPHEFVCVTDDPSDLDRDIRVVPLTSELMLPGCRYQKLMIYRPDAAEILGERILYLDLDLVLTGGIDHLVDRDEDCVAWENPAWPGAPRKCAVYNTSLVLLRAGSQPQIWNEFDPRRSPAEVAATRLSGTDQVWVSMKVRNPAGWNGPNDGVWSYRKHVVHKNLPKDACVVVFHGEISPCLPKMQQNHAWVRDNYR